MLRFVRTPAFGVVARRPTAHSQIVARAFASTFTQPPPASAATGGDTASSSAAGESKHLRAQRKELVDRILRVDQAGELGAVRIYQGQLAVMRALPPFMQDPKAIAAVEHMLEQEKQHLATFNALIPERRARPTALMPLWNIAGAAAGGISALFGTKTAMALTIAVEDVIMDHYNDQIRALHEDPVLKEREKALRKTLVQFRDDEGEHHATGVQHQGLEAPLYQAFSQVVKGACNVAIKLAERV